MCMGILPVCISVHCIHTVAIVVRRGHQIAWNWNYKWLQATMWILEIELESPARGAATVIN